MNLVKLTKANYDNEVCFVNMDLLAAMYRFTEPSYKNEPGQTYTVLVFPGRSQISVKETPEEIEGMIGPTINTVQIL